MLHFNKGLDIYAALVQRVHKVDADFQNLR